MPAINNVLRSELVHYKNSTPEEREKIKASWKKKVADLPVAIKTNAEAIHAYQTMAYATQVTKYADILHNMENKLPFDILNNFTDMGTRFAEQEFAELNQYFKFQSRQLALKVHPKDIPTKIWQLFQKAQIKHREGQENPSKYDLDLTHPAADQLFPIQIQGLFAGAENHAVDRVYANKSGLFNFVYNFGYLSPGGGMVAPGENSDDKAKIIEQMLIEHLEEEHANLYLKATAQYNSLDRTKFYQTITHSIDSKKDAINTAVVNFSENLHGHLRGLLGGQSTNAEGLNELIGIIDEQLAGLNVDTNKSAIFSLRAEIQVATFKLTQTYTDALIFVKQNTKCCIIEQFLDTRALGGKQFSHTYMMTGMALEDWFQKRFHNAANNHIQYGDDITGAVKQRLSYLQLLAKKPAEIKFSHVLIPLEYTKMAFEEGLFNVENVWNNEEYTIARAAIISDDQEFNKAINDLIEPLKEKNALYRERILQLANEAIVFQSSGKQTHVAKASDEALSVKDILNLTVSLIKGTTNAAQYAAKANAIQEGKLSPALIAFGSIMLAICAAAIAAGIVLLPLPVAAVAAAATATVTGVAGGLGLFGGQQKGLSKAACQLAKDAKAFEASAAQPSHSA